MSEDRAVRAAEWSKIAERLLETIDDLIGYDVLIHEAVEHELKKAYELGQHFPGDEQLREAAKEAVVAISELEGTPIRYDIGVRLAKALTRLRSALAGKEE